MSLETGTQVGDYRILGSAGAGGYGEVFQAEHSLTHRVEALKILAHRRQGDDEESARFLQEIQLQASLAHPNIAAVHNAFWTGEGLALVMEFVYGEPLSAILARGRVPLVPGIAYVLGTLSALAYAHSQGVVHGDVKPHNIIVRPNGDVKLTDFGLARSAAKPSPRQPGEFAGSPAYMSPEQAAATGKISAASDLYSAGVVLYEIVSGFLPFTGETPFAVMQAHQKEAVVPPSRYDPTIPAALDEVILTALQKDPSRRFGTAAEFQAALYHAGLLAVPANRQRVIRLAVTAALAVVGALALWFAPHHKTAEAGAPAHRATVQAAPDAIRTEPTQDSYDYYITPQDMPVAAGQQTPAAPKVRPQKKDVRAAELSFLPASSSSGEAPDPKLTLPPAPSAQPPVPQGGAAELPAVIATEPLETAPAPPSDSATPAKRRNPVVRTFDKLFHGKKPPQPKE